MVGLRVLRPGLLPRTLVLLDFVLGIVACHWLVCLALVQVSGVVGQGHKLAR